MRSWWAFALTLLAAVPSRAETFVHDELSIDIDVSGACVVIPSNKHDSPNCEGVDVDAMRLNLAAPTDHAAVFVGFIPYASGKFYLEVRDARGASERLNDNDAAQAARVIRANIAKDSQVERTSEPVISPIARDDGVDRVTIRVDARYAGTAEDVRSTTYVFLGDGSTMITTKTGVTHASEVERSMQPILASVRVPRRSFLPGLGRALGTYVVPVQLAFVVGILLLDLRMKTKKRKKKQV